MKTNYILHPWRELQAAFTEEPTIGYSAVWTDIMHRLYLPIQKEKSAKRIYWKSRRSTMRDVWLFRSFCQIVQRIL